MSRHLARASLLLAAVLVVVCTSFGCDRRESDSAGSGPSSSSSSSSTSEARKLLAAARAVSASKVAANKVAATKVTLAPAARLYPLTPEGSDRFLVRPVGPDTVVQAAPTNRGGNTRVVWVSPTSQVGVDQQVCATWDSWSGLAQPGLALRVRGDGPRVRAVTVTGNIVWGARFGFNVHQWDTAIRSKSGMPVVYAGGADLSHTFGPANGLVALPWHICARVQGRMLDFKVWPSPRAEPRWGDTRYGRRFQLAVSATYAGRAGWYAGHLRPGDKLVISDQVTRSLGG